MTQQNNKRYKININIKLKSWIQNKLNIREPVISIKYINKITDKAICVLLTTDYYHPTYTPNVPKESLSYTFQFDNYRTGCYSEYGYLWIPKSAILNFSDIIIIEQYYAKFLGSWQDSENKTDLNLKPIEIEQYEAY